MIDVALYQPEIPPNTGNIIRLCANTGCPLHLIEPLGFALDDRRLRRAGLDYDELASVQRHPSYEAFLQALDGRRIVALTTRGHARYDRWKFSGDDVVLFGPETRGLPDSVLQALPLEARLRLPMCPDSRSLNLANAVAVVVYEAWRQAGFEGAA